jgi:hypothetical protein
VSWGRQDQAGLCRDLVDRSEGRWTPAAVAAMPIPQLLVVMADPRERILRRVNAIRARKGLQPVKSI